MREMEEDDGGGEKKKKSDNDYGSIKTAGPAEVADVNVEGKWGARHTFTLLSFLGMANVYAMRVNLSVAIVAMVKHSSMDANFTHPTVGTECPVPELDRMSTSQDEGFVRGDFAWDSRDQGLILGSFFYGYIATQIPGGILAERRGGKWLFGVGTLTTSVLTLVSPWAAKWGGKWAFMCVRVLEGLGEGVTFPAMQIMVARWTPITERSRLASAIFSGAQFGTVVSMPLSGWLAQDCGWEWVFYSFGALGCVWFAFWATLVFDSPAKHPRISQRERAYIESNLLKCDDDEEDDDDACSSSFPPLSDIMTSPPFVGLICAHVGQNWGFYTLLTEAPTYLKNIQHFSLKENGFLSGLPYLMMWLASFPFGALSDYLIRSNVLTIGGARKLFNSIATTGPALGLLWLSFVGCDHAMAVLALCVSVGLNGASYAGFQVNHVDLSPRYAGTLMGITNTFANVCGFLTPYLTGAITNGNETFSAWRAVFLTSSAAYLVFNSVFVVFGSGRVQPWNSKRRRKNKKGEGGDDG